MLPIWCMKMNILYDRFSILDIVFCVIVIIIVIILVNIIMSASLRLIKGIAGWFLLGAYRKSPKDSRMVTLRMTSRESRTSQWPSHNLQTASSSPRFLVGIRRSFSKHKGQ